MQLSPHLSPISPVRANDTFVSNRTNSQGLQIVSFYRVVFQGKQGWRWSWSHKRRCCGQHLVEDPVTVSQRLVATKDWRKRSSSYVEHSVSSCEIDAVWFGEVEVEHFEPSRWQSGELSSNILFNYYLRALVCIEPGGYEAWLTRSLVVIGGETRFADCSDWANSGVTVGDYSLWCLCSQTICQL